MPVSRITQSRSKPLVSLPDRGLAPSTSMLTTPSDVPSAPDASRTSGVDSSNVDVPHGTATSRGELEGTRARPPTLTANNATKGKYKGVTSPAVGRRMIETDEVQLLSL
jgi:hypothetical protein